MRDLYFCPGESQPISPAIHLARLASSYDACRTCQHRQDTGLMPRTVRERLERGKCLAAGPEFHAEGVQGVYHNQLTVAAMRRLAAAFALVLRERIEKSEPSPRDPLVVLAGDGRPMTAEFLAAAADGLRYGGCHVSETSAATSAMLALAQSRLQADGGLLLGNPADRSYLMGIKFWGPGGLPWSRGAELAAIERLHQGPLNRPTRSAGNASRASIEAEYLKGLKSYFHALRPLEFVLDTTSATLRRLLDQLLARVACTVVGGDAADPASRAGPSPPSQPAPIAGAARLAAPTKGRQLGRRTLAAGANFGVSVDGDGEAVLVVDERGCEVPAARLFAVLARHLQREQPGASIVVEPGEMPAGGVVGSLDHVVLAADATRNAMAAAMAENRAVLGGGSSGRFWFPCRSGVPPLSDCQMQPEADATAQRGGTPRLHGSPPCPAPDALHLIAVLLTILSQRDWPLSEVMARGLEPAGSSR